MEPRELRAGEPIVPGADPGVEVRSAGVWGFVFGLAFLAIGGVAVALAVDDGFAAGKVVFAHDAWRFPLGAVGVVLAFLAVRGLMRTAGGRGRTLTPERRSTIRRRGRALVVVGAWLCASATIDAFAREAVRFDSWAEPFFGYGGGYLVLMGLSLQLDPTGPLRRQRLEQGDGIPGTATILRASDTGSTTNEAPLVKIDYRLDVAGRAAEVSGTVVMEQAKLALLIPGATVDVLVDRGDPRVFKVDWDSWRPPAAPRAEE